MRGYNTENNTNKHFPEKIQHLFLCTSWTLRPIISPKGTPPPKMRPNRVGTVRYFWNRIEPKSTRNRHQIIINQYTYNLEKKKGDLVHQGFISFIDNATTTTLDRTAIDMTIRKKTTCLTWTLSMTRPASSYKCTRRRRTARWHRFRDGSGGGCSVVRGGRLRVLQSLR